MGNASLFSLIKTIIGKLSLNSRYVSGANITFCSLASWTLLLIPITITITHTEAVFAAQDPQETLTPNTASETQLDISLRFNYWHGKISGDIHNNQNQVTADQLGFDVENQSFIDLEIIHEFPFVPNFKLSTDNLSFNAETSLGKSIDYASQSFTENEILDTEMDLTHTQVSLYYDLADLFFNVYFGISAKQFNGEYRIASATGEFRQTIDETITHFFLYTRSELPATQWVMESISNFGNFEEDHAQDLSMNLVYPLNKQMHVYYGYRYFSLKIKDDYDIYVKTKGPLLGVKFFL